MNAWTDAINLWIGLSLSVRLVLLFVLGAIVAGQLNRGIFRWTWHPKHYDPWTRPLPNAPPRNLLDKVPIFGWLGLARESKLHDRAHWVQPFLIELGCGFFFAWYYHYLMTGGLLPPAISTPPDAAGLHAIYLQHIVLISLMIVATFIDFDARIIPDQVTVPGFLAGLVLCWLLPFAALPVPDGPPFFAVGVGQNVETITLHAATPSAWPEVWNEAAGLAMGLLLALGWWLAISPKIIWYRGGMTKFFRYLLASFWRYAVTPFYMGLLTFLLLFVAGAWYWGSAETWQAVLSALLGMAFAGLLIWLVRVFAGWALGQEAMGFGDVTLMCMIGAYVGWQPIMVIFFLAPFIACVFALINWFLTGDAYLAYGPYLCLGTLAVLIFWAPLWQKYGPLLELGPWLPAVFLALPVVLGGMLMVWQWFKFRFIFPDEA